MFRKPFQDFPSLKHLRMPFGRELCTINSRSGQDLRIGDPEESTLSYNRDVNEFELFMSLDIATTHRAFPVSTGENDDRSRIGWGPHSLSYRSVLELVPPERRYVQMLHLSEPLFPDNISGVLESLRYNHAAVPETLCSFEGPVSGLVELDIGTGCWPKLERFGTQDARAFPCSDSELSSLGRIVGRSPRFKSLYLFNSSCSSQQWHPLIVFLRAVAKEGSSSLEYVNIGPADGWSNVNGVTRIMRDQVGLELFGKFPRLQTISFSWPNLPSSTSPEASPGMNKALEIAALLKVAIGTKVTFEVEKLSYDGTFWTIGRRTATQET